MKKIQQITPEFLEQIGVCKNPWDYGTREQLTGTVIDLINYPNARDVDLVYTAISYKMIPDEVVINYAKFCSLQIVEYLLDKINVAGELYAKALDAIDAETPEQLIKAWKPRAGARENIINEIIEAHNNSIQGAAITVHDHLLTLSGLINIPQSQVEAYQKKIITKLIIEYYEKE